MSLQAKKPRRAGRRGLKMAGTLRGPFSYSSVRLAADLILERLRPAQQHEVRQHDIEISPALACVSNLSKVLKKQNVDDWAQTLFPWRHIDASRSLLGTITDR